MHKLSLLCSVCWQHKFYSVYTFCLWFSCLHTSNHISVVNTRLKHEPLLNEKHQHFICQFYNLVNICLELVFFCINSEVIECIVLFVVCIIVFCFSCHLIVVKMLWFLSVTFHLCASKILYTCINIQTYFGITWLHDIYLYVVLLYAQV